MRLKRDPQGYFQFTKPASSSFPELALILELLESHSKIEDIVAKDFVTPTKSKAGAKGMTIRQIVRVAIAKGLTQWSYRELFQRIDDSISLREFCCFHTQALPRFNVLAENVKRISAKSWEAINKILVVEAEEQRIENGRTIRIDTTATETNIHHPTDSRLIEDCIRVINRLMERSRERFSTRKFRNRMRATKKRVRAIANIRSPKKRTKLYQELLKIGNETLEECQAVYEELKRARPPKQEGLQYLQALLVDFKRLLDQFPQVLEQCRRRVIDGESLPPNDKLVSIFEPHTDIIKKGGREITFGHKVFLTTGKSNMILDCQLERGNPFDGDFWNPALDKVTKLFGKAPEQITADDGFASEANAQEARDRGVTDIVFGGKAIEELPWVRSKSIQKKLRKWRNGIEGIISAVKRAFGLRRCNWSGWEGFCSYVWLSVVSFNLQVFARHLME